MSYVDELMRAKHVPIEVVHHFSSGVYAKQMTLPAGCFAVSHKHRHSHLSILAAGMARVEVDGISTDYTAPACIEIAADAHHKITALADVVWYCIHATEETDPNRIDETVMKE